MKLNLRKLVYLFFGFILSIELWLPWLVILVFILFFGSISYQNYQEDTEQRKLEEPKWQAALDVNKIEAYFDYLHSCSLCEHHAEAELMLSRFQKKSGLMVDLNINHQGIKHPESVIDADIAPDDRKLATANGSVFWLWEAETGEHWQPNTQAFIGCGMRPNHLLFSVDGGSLVSVDESGMACFWDIQTGRLKTNQQLVDSNVEKLAISLHGDYLAWRTFAENSGFWNSLNGSMHSLDHENVEVLAFDDHDVLLTASRNRIARWDMASDALLGQVEFEEEGFLMGFSGNARYVYFGIDTKLVIRDAINGNVIRLIDNPAELSAVCSGRYGKTVVTATREGDLLLWDSATGRRLTELKAHPEGVGILVCSTSGDRILSVSEDHFHAKLWDVNAMMISVTDVK